MKSVRNWGRLGMNFDENSLYNIKSSVEGKRYSLFELATWKNGLAFKKINFSETGVPVIKIAELNNGIGGTTAYTQQTFSEDVHLCKGDLLFSWSGNPQTSIDIFRFNLDEGWLNQHIFRVTPDEKTIDKDYFYFLMKNLKPYFTQIATNKQTTGLGHVTIADIKRMSVVVPSLDVQREIVSYLKPIDDKVELNTAINNNLEQQAQAIYSCMFIEHRQESWITGQLSDLISVKYGKDHKKLADGNYPVYGSGGIMRYVEKPLYTGESVLIPRKGTLNNVMYVNEAFWSVDTMFYTEMLRPNIAKFVYHFVKSKNLASLNAGSAVPSMTTNILNAMQLYIPDEKTIEKFENIVSPMYSEMQENTKESKILANTRDTLLPKLMSGELDVSDIDL